VEIASLAERIAGMSAAEARFMCDRAAMNALRRFLTNSATETVDAASVLIGQVDFDEALRGEPASSGASHAPPSGS
jgi:hypothetical protein